MDQKIKIIVIIADITAAAFLIYLAIFQAPRIVINYDTSQLISISGASGVGIFFLYYKRLKKYNPKLVKSLELLLYLIPPTVTSFPFLAKVSYYLTVIVTFLVMLGWFNFGLIKVGTSEKEEEKKIIKETIIITGMVTAGVTILLVVILWGITTICVHQCANPS